MKCKAFLCDRRADPNRRGFCRRHSETLAEYRKRKACDQPLIDQVVATIESIEATKH